MAVRPTGGVGAARTGIPEPGGAAVLRTTTADSSPRAAPGSIVDFGDGMPRTE